MLRTIEYQGSLVQGELKQNENVFCSCSDGNIPIDKCNCENGWANQATVDVDGKEYTGKLIPSVRKDAPSFQISVIEENEDGSCNVEIEMDEYSSEFFKEEAETQGMSIEDYILSLLEKYSKEKDE